MSAREDGESSTPGFRPFTKAERIQQLNDIDKSITQLLQSAGLAIKTLSAAQSASSSPSSSDRREAFKNASNSYLKTLQSVDVRLKRQIYGLEEADIIPADKSSMKNKGDTQDSQASSGLGKSSQSTSAATAHVDGGLGKLDIGWLNSRSGRVGRDMEAELWAEAKEFLEKVLVEQQNSRGTSDRDEDVTMGL
ncbi:mediator complex protein-domain-containing protein [Xylogone sp. PMI_703]|nr:mediator complex protein-domain-containing protein [Xylogone sp. PMI_703]